MFNEKNGQQFLLKIKSETYNEKYLRLKSKRKEEILFFSGKASHAISVIPQLSDGVIFIKKDDSNFEFVDFRDITGVNIIEGKEITYVGIQIGVYNNIRYNDAAAEEFMKKVLNENDFSKQCEVVAAGFADAAEINLVNEAIRNIEDKIFECNGRIKISELADIADYSVRHFYRIFVENMGISPKLYLKILRCNMVMERMTENPYCEITDYMESLGYFDQAHFQREFKWFTGITPKTYLKKITGIG